MANATRVLAWNVLHGVAALTGFGLASYRQPGRVGTMGRIRDVKRGRQMLLTYVEANQIFSLVNATAKLGGCMAEVGVFRGASARLIREADSQRPLHLFDTFEGLPTPAETDTGRKMGRFDEGQFSSSLEDVQNYLKEFQGLHFYKGLFPATGDGVKEERFSFVHSDVDLYESTKSVLEFFYPRMIPGGVIISHDFVTCFGPNRAMTEFFRDKPEPLIELPGDQGMIVRLA